MSLRSDLVQLRIAWPRDAGRAGLARSARNTPTGPNRRISSCGRSCAGTPPAEEIGSDLDPLNPFRPGEEARRNRVTVAYRRLASVRQAVAVDILEFVAGGLFGDSGPQRDSDGGSLCTGRTTRPAEFRKQGRERSNQSRNRGDQGGQCFAVHLGDSLGESYENHIGL
jgi:hypothetical protein